LPGLALLLHIGRFGPLLGHLLVRTHLTRLVHHITSFGGLTCRLPTSASIGIAEDIDPVLTELWSH
jgi:hypothetical protein